MLNILNINDYIILFDNFDTCASKDSDPKLTDPATSPWQWHVVRWVLWCTG